MKKIVALGIGCFTLVLIVISLIFALLYTRYLTPSVQWLTSQLWPGRLTFSRVEYHYPLHFRLSHPTITLEEHSLSLEQLDIWLNPQIMENGKWQVDSLLIQGGNFTSERPVNFPLTHWTIAHLALQNIEVAGHGFIAQGVNLQIKHPQWLARDQWFPYGALQLTAEQLDWQGETIKTLLVDANYRPQDSTIYGASFEWNGSQVSGQAEQYPTGWSLINTTINQLNLTGNTINALQSYWPAITRYLHHINSLDILQSHLAFQDIEIENFNLSLENIVLPRSVWQQEAAYLSLNADKIEWQQLEWIEPAFQLTLSPQRIDIKEFSSQLLQGYVQFTGQLSPTHLNMERLTLNGIKWLDEAIAIPKWPTALAQIEHITLEQLSGSNLQIIQLATQPIWQLSGLNIEGNNLEVVKQHQWGLWNGQLTLSTNSASVADLITTQAIIEMQSQQGDWQIKRAFFPLTQGYIDLVGSWHFTQPSAPWSIELHTDSIPLTLLNTWNMLPFKLDAFADIDLQLHGLSGDYAMLSHSLDGEIQASLRSGLLSFQQQNTLTIQPFQLDNLHLQADRGRIVLPESTLLGPALSAKLSGELDLLAPQQGKFELTLEQKCQLIRFDLLRRQQHSQSVPNCSAIHSDEPVQ